jgi:hypothetical protein
MTDERSPPSALRGRLADVYVPALVEGNVEALSRRLGNRATVDDPLYGRASSLASIDPLLARVASYFAEGKAAYVHVGSTTGVDRDAAEGRIAMRLGGAVREIPIAVIAERRRLREIELRIYYAPSGTPAGHKPRSPLASHGPKLPLASPIESIVEGIKTASIEQALAGFEEVSEVVDPTGRRHGKHDGGMGRFLADLGVVGADIGGSADDGRSSCVELTLTRKGHEPSPALFAFERGDSGLVRELRMYWE